MATNRCLPLLLSSIRVPGRLLQEDVDFLFNPLFIVWRIGVCRLLIDQATQIGQLKINRRVMLLGSFIWTESQASPGPQSQTVDWCRMWLWACWDSGRDNKGINDRTSYKVNCWRKEGGRPLQGAWGHLGCLPVSWGVPRKFCILLPCTRWHSRSHCRFVSQGERQAERAGWCVTFLLHSWTGLLWSHHRRYGFVSVDSFPYGVTHPFKFFSLDQLLKVSELLAENQVILVNYFVKSELNSAVVKF